MNNNSKSTLQVFDCYKPTLKNEMEANEDGHIKQKGIGSSKSNC